MSWIGRDQEILIEMDKHKIDICMLMETKKKGQGNTRYRNYILFHSGKRKEERAKSGVGILMHKKFENQLRNVEYIDDTMIRVTMEFGDSSFDFISVYAPDISKPREEREKFFSSLTEMVKSTRRQNKLFVMGDLNSRIGNNEIPGVMQRFNEDTLNENGELLIYLCMDQELRINNTFFQHKEQHKTIWSTQEGAPQ